MKIQEIKVRDREVTLLTELNLMVFSLLLAALSITIIYFLWRGAEPRFIGLLIGSSLLTMAVIFAVLKKGLLPEEEITAVE
ncbi:MAG: hypothetical protein HY555_00130 [Euryarchaeota archaeon]|nr:hypothetical protein [Euryarchaeota archaeon]